MVMFAQLPASVRQTALAGLAIGATWAHIKLLLIASNTLSAVQCTIFVRKEKFVQQAVVNQRTVPQVIIQLLLDKALASIALLDTTVWETETSLQFVLLALTVLRTQGLATSSPVLLALMVTSKAWNKCLIA